MAGLVIVAWLGTAVLGAAPAIAHADFVTSDPAHNEVVNTPVVEIEITFSAPVQPQESDIAVVDGDGAVVPITVFQRTDDHVIVQPDTELTEGTFILRWATVSEDGHGIEGVVRFDVIPADVPTEATDEGDEETSDAAGSVTTIAPEPTDVTPTSTVSAPTTTVAAQTVVEPQPSDTEGIGVVEVEADRDVTGFVGGVGRWMSMLGALVAIGATSFAAFALIGTRAEISRVVTWIRAGGVALVVGTLVEVGAVAVSASGSGVLVDPIGILDALPTSVAYAGVLRIAGGIALLQSPALVTTSRRTRDMAHAGMGGVATASGASEPPDDSERLVVREEWLILAGLAAIAVSYLLDGHSATLDVIGRTANLVHVVAGGVWLGGIVVLGDLALRRRRHSVPTGLAESTVRYSRVATIALVAVAVAGGVLAWSILDSPGGLFDGTWGRILLGKIILVAVAAGIGAYNHFRVVPRIERDPDQVAPLARTLTAEAITLVIVVALTAALVIAAP